MLKTLKQIILILSMTAAVAAATLLQILVLINTDIVQAQARRVIPAVMPGSIRWDYLSISPLRGRVEIRNAVMAGEDRRPIARFDRLIAYISLPSALRGRLDIVDARLEKPECFLELDGDGQLNIVSALGIRPKKKKPDRKPVRLPAFLNVRRCELVKGRFGFARPSGGFELDIGDIRSVAGLDFAAETGSITLSVGESYFTVKNRRTDVKRLDLESAVRNGIAERLRLKLWTTASDVVFNGEIGELFRNPSFNVNARFTLSLSELRDVLNTSGPLTGTVTGTLAGRGTVNNPSISVTAVYSGGTILGNMVKSIRADIAMNDRVVSVPEIRVFSSEGYIDLRGSMDLRNAYPSGFIRPGKDTGKISYTAALTSRRFNIRSIPGIPAGVQGLLDADITLSGTGFSPAYASAELSGKASIMNFSRGDNAEPAHLGLRARAAMSEGIIRISGIESTLGSARLSASGSFTVATKGLQASFSLDSPDVTRESASLGFGNCGGRLNAGGSISGTILRPVVIAGLTAESLMIRDVQIGSAAFHASLDGAGMVTIDRFTVSNNTSRISLNGRAGLFNEGTFSIRPDPPIDLNIGTFAVEAGDFQPRINGRLLLSGQVTGTLHDPAGSLSLTGDGIDLGFQKFRALNCSMNFKERKARIDPLVLTLSRGEAVRCSGWVGTDLTYGFFLESDPISVADIQAINRAGGLRGLVTLVFRGSGSLGNPSLQGTVAATHLALRDTAYNDMTMNVIVRDRRIAVKGKLNFDIDGTYDFRSRRFTIGALFEKTDLTPYLSALGRKNLGGTVSGRIQADGYAANPDRSDLSISLSQLELFNAGERLVSSRKFGASLRNGVIAIPGINLALLDAGWIDMNGSGNLTGSLSINLDGRIPLDLANRFTDSLTNFSGTLALKGGITGTGSHPHLNADVRLDDIGFSVPAIGNDVRHLDGTLSFTSERLMIRDIHGLLGQGRFTVMGTMGVDGFRIRDIRVDATGRNIPIDIPDMMHMTFDTNARITGSTARALVKGNFTLIEGIYYQDLVLHPLQDIGGLAGLRPGAPEETKRSSLLNATALDVAISNRFPFAVDNNIASLKISGDLRMIGTLDRPLLNGSARVESGVVHYLGRDFDIIRGKIDFINPYKIEPLISISSNARIQKWLVSIAVTGTPAALKYDLSSSPVLDSNNILSLIMLGKTTGGALTLTPTDLLGQMIAFNYGGQIKKSTGIDTIEVKTQDAQSKGPFKGQYVTIGKNLDRRFSIYYSIGKDSREIISSSAVKYKLNDSVLLDLDYDSKGRVGIDLQYHKEFR